MSAKWTSKNNSMYHSKQGTDAVVRLLGFFSAKNKKAFVKLLKGKVPDMEWYIKLFLGVHFADNLA